MMWRRVLLLGFIAVATADSSVVAQDPADRPIAIVVEIDGIIHPIAAEYLAQAIDEADTSDAAVVILLLRTPGGDPTAPGGQSLRPRPTSQKVSWHP